MHIYGNLKKALFELSDDVIVGWWSIFLHAVCSKAFCMDRMYILERFNSINNSIVYIFTQYNLLQIINTEETVDLFSVM